MARKRSNMVRIDGDLYEVAARFAEKQRGTIAWAVNHLLQAGIEAKGINKEEGVNMTYVEAIRELIDQGYVNIDAGDGWIDIHDALNSSEDDGTPVVIQEGYDGPGVVRIVALDNRGYLKSEPLAKVAKVIAETAEELANNYEGDNIWDDLFWGHFGQLIDEQATQEADPSSMSDIVVFTDGSVLIYDEPAKSWLVK